MNVWCESTDFNPCVNIVTVSDRPTDHDKCYAPDAVVLPSIPPISLCKWICRRCGKTGTDRMEISQDNEYEQLKRRFAHRDNGTDADSYKHCGPPHIGGA